MVNFGKNVFYILPTIYLIVLIALLGNLPKRINEFGYSYYRVKQFYSLEMIITRDEIYELFLNLSK